MSGGAAAARAVPVCAPDDRDPGPSLYVHYPFCEQHCTYCDFYTVTDPRRGHALHATLLELLAREIALWREAEPALAARPLASLYFGGGTPSMAPPASLAAFVDGVRRTWGFAPGAEVTLEIQPSPGAAECVAEWAAAGITRFSAGVQTFDDRVLAQTGRRHTAADTARLLDELSARGLAANADLIYAWPGQHADDWRTDLLALARWPLAHVSAYELTYHPGTVLERHRARGRVKPAPDSATESMFRIAHEELGAQGFEHYEISNFARPGGRSVHNSAYWRLRDCAAAGPAAHGCIALVRYENPPDLAAHAAALEAGRLPRRALPPPEDAHLLALECLHMALRVADGVDLAGLTARTGADLAATRASALDDLAAAGLLTREGSVVRPTFAGWLQHETLTEALL